MRNVILLSIMCGIGLSYFASAQAGLDQGRVGFWTFNSCDARDDSGNGNHGMLFNDVRCVEGMFGMALAFDGRDDYVEFPRFRTPANAFTYALWFKPDSRLNEQSDRQDLTYGALNNERFRPHITFNFHGEGRITLLVRIGEDNFDDVSTRRTSWDANTWYHLAFTWNGDRFRVYVDGDEERSVQHAGRHFSYTGFVLGLRSRDLEFDFKGSIDELSIYNRALNASEVSSLIMPEPPIGEGGIFCLEPLQRFFNLCD